MQKLYNTLSLQYILPRPVGFIRYGIFLLSFLISRIPLWFVLFSATLYMGVLNLQQCFFIMFTILLCRTFVESEMSGGKNSFTFFAIFRVLRVAFVVLIYFIILGFIIYLLYPENKDTFGKISLFFALITLPFLLKSNSNIIYHYGYYTKTSLSLILIFLWFYLGFIPDTLIMNITIILLIYILEFYNLLYNKPLGLMPNQSSL